jgi:hypothetical protein
MVQPGDGRERVRERMRISQPLLEGHRALHGSDHHVQASLGVRRLAEHHRKRA